MAGIRRDDRIEQLQHPWEDDTEIYDLSKSGVGIFLIQPMETGVVKTVSLNVGNLSISAKAKVAHCNIFGKRYRTGMQFVDVKGDAVTILREMSNMYSRGVPVKVNIQ